MRRLYPFTAIVGQEKMKRALILNAVNPLIGGVLIRGERGTAKSTAARALAVLLPEIEVVIDSPFRDDPDRPDQWSDWVREKVAAGQELNIETLKSVRETIPEDFVLLSNTGVTIRNLEDNFKFADGAVVGTTFKYDGIFKNHVDKNRVSEFMKEVKRIRK